MVCSISVSASGIVAILTEFPISVSNKTTIAASMVEGSLLGERNGAGVMDLALWLFESDTGVKETEMDLFCENVSFAQNSKQIEYVLKFALDKDATNGVFVTLENAGLTNEDCYEASYKFGYGKERPDWSEAEDIKPNYKYVVDAENPYIWLRATLSIKSDAYSRVITEANWSFLFNFDGVAATAD